MKAKTSFKIIKCCLKVIFWTNVASKICELMNEKYEPYNF